MTHAKVELPERDGYVRATSARGWSRHVLVVQTGAYAAVDEQMKAPEDGPAIGRLLCRSRSEVVAEYAGRDSKRSMGVAGYQLVEALPKDVEASLRSVEMVERELAEVEG